MEMRPRPEWVGKPLRELDLRGRHRINVVAVRSDGQVNAMPDPETTLGADDIMLVVSQTEA